MFRGRVIQSHTELDSKLSGKKLAYYLIHYPGWSRRYDIWRQEHDILKLNTENIERMNLIYNQNIAKLRSAYAIYKKTSAKLVLVNGVIQYDNTNQSKKGRSRNKNNVKKRKQNI